MGRYQCIILLLLASAMGFAQLSDCEPEFSTTLLEINNIRARIGLPNNFFNNDGDAGFEVPAGSGKNSIYAHTDWIGGKTADEQVHLSANTYFSGGGSDYISGPLSNNGLAYTTPDVCEEYAELYHAERVDAIIHHEYYDRVHLVANGGDPAILETPPFENGYVAPDYFYTWPAHNDDPSFAHQLAPFYDKDQDGIYEPDAGDYPGFDLYGEYSCIDYTTSIASRLQGHSVVWQVYNDSGLHTQTGGEPLGIEIQCSTFGFSDCSGLDNTLFQNKRIINRSGNTYYETNIGQWTDTDLGCPTDDRVGCDVERGIAYSYNDDLLDNDCNGIIGYGNNPPIISFQFLAGPYQDEDGIDNPFVYNVSQAEAQNGIVYPGQGVGYGDSIVDNERLRLTRFTYYRRSDQTGTIFVNSEPDIAIEYYQYISGRWKNNSPVTFGEDGVGAEISARFMFPGSSDPLGYSTNGEIVNDAWSDEGAGFDSGDRRFLAITGSFTFDPGEVQEITTAFNWTEGLSTPEITLNSMRINSDHIQQHFEYCFQLIDNLPLVDDFTFTQSENDLTFSLPFYYDYEAQWNFGDGYTAQGLSVDHTFTEAGTFDVCVTVYNCSGPQNICEPITITPLDLEEIETESLVLIYPNPVQDKLFLHSSRIGKELLGIIIYDARGNRILKARWEEVQQSIMLPEDMSAGLYVLNAIYSDGLEYSSSFLKSVD